MWSYVTDELPSFVAEHFPVDVKRQSILGHSMGGHGALTVALRNPDRYRAASAFAPIVAPSQVPWGNKALGGYLGDNKAAWRKHDTVALIEDGARFSDFLVDYGDADQFLTEQLRPNCCRRRARKRTSPSPCAARTVTTTATTSSPPSWPIICAGTPNGWKPDRCKRPILPPRRNSARAAGWRIGARRR